MEAAAFDEFGHVQPPCVRHLRILREDGHVLDEVLWHDERLFGFVQPGGLLGGAVLHKFHAADGFAEDAVVGVVLQAVAVVFEADRRDGAAVLSKAENAAVAVVGGP